MAQITFKDIADRCNVSTATVSNVIRNKGRVSEITRQRVLLAMQELGYVYNQSAANLRDIRSNQIGLVIPDIRNPFYAGLTAALSKKLEANGYMLFLASCEEDLIRQEDFIETLHKNRAAGLVFCEARDTSDDTFYKLKNRNMPVVMIVRPIEDYGFDFVGMDNVLGGRLATDYLIKLGHKNIAFIGGEPNSKTRSHRFSGYVSRLIEAGIAPDEKMTMCCDKKRLDGAQKFLEIYQQSPQVTAVVCYDDTVAVGVMKAIESLGLSVGKDVSVIGFDDIPEASDVEPALTTISAAHEIGEKAGELLFNRINGNDEPAIFLNIPPTLVIRNSCGEFVHRENHLVSIP